MEVEVCTILQKITPGRTGHKPPDTRPPHNCERRVHFGSRATQPAASLDHAGVRLVERDAHIMQVEYPKDMGAHVMSQY